MKWVFRTVQYKRSLIFVNDWLLSRTLVTYLLACFLTWEINFNNLKEALLSNFTKPKANLLSKFFSQVNSSLKVLHENVIDRLPKFRSVQPAPSSFKEFLLGGRRIWIYFNASKKKFWAYFFLIHWNWRCRGNYVSS